MFQNQFTKGFLKHAELIIAVAGNNPGGHDDMVFRQETTPNTNVLVISSTTSNKPPSIVSGYLTSGVWNPVVAIGDYAFTKTK